MGETATWADLPPEPGEVGHEDHGIPGPAEEPEDSDAVDPEDEDLDNYADDDDPDELGGEIDADPRNDGLQEPEDDSEDD